MPKPDPSAVLKMLREAADFTRTVGMQTEASDLEKFYVRFQTEQATHKLLQGPVDKTMSQAFRKARETLFDERNQPRPGTELLREQYGQLWAAFFKLLYPQPPELDISDFLGSEQVKDKKVAFEGDSSGVRSIVESGIILVGRYSQVLGSGNFSAAYALTDSGLRAGMSLQRFIGDHERAAREFHGPALEFHIDRFNYVCADDAARKKSNTSVEGWPKGTPKENRRGAVGGFWIRDRAAQTGCGGTLWIAEEDGEYRIAKFSYWRP